MSDKARARIGVVLGLVAASVVACPSPPPSAPSAFTTPPDASVAPRPCQVTTSPKANTTTLHTTFGVDELTVVVASPKTETGLPTGASSSTMTLTLSGSAYLQIANTATKTLPSSVDAAYGSAFTGIKRSHFQSDGKTVTGNVDGRPVVPFDANQVPSPASVTPSIQFADGKPPPNVYVDPSAEKRATALFEQAKSDASRCTSAALDATNDSSALLANSVELVKNSVNRAEYPETASVTTEHSAAKLGSPMFNGIQGPIHMFMGVPGHPSNTSNGPSCVAALAGAESAYVVCLVAVGWSCSSTGWYYPICAAIGVTGCSIAYFAATTGFVTGSACMPVHCGSAACFSNETCLNTGTGLCCGPGTSACAGAIYCNSPGVPGVSAENCIAGAGTCCPATQTICGNQCCPPGNACNAATGQCCPPGAACTPCGHQGQPCCPGDVCTGSGCSLASHSCVACPTTGTTPTTIVNQTVHLGSNCYGNHQTQSFGRSCDPHFRQGTCTATLTSLANDSTCSAAWANPNDPSNCNCIANMQTPNDCSKWADCQVVVTESYDPVGCP